MDRVELSYEAPRDRKAREVEARRQVPHTRLGIWSCGILLTSVLSTGLLVLLASLDLERVSMAIVGIVALLAYPLCLVGGIPLALGGLADEGHRKVVAWWGLVGNIIWLITPWVVAIFVRWW